RTAPMPRPSPTPASPPLSSAPATSPRRIPSMSGWPWMKWKRRARFCFGLCVQSRSRSPSGTVAQCRPPLWPFPLAWLFPRPLLPVCPFPRPLLPLAAWLFPPRAVLLVCDGVLTLGALFLTTGADDVNRCGFEFVLGWKLGAVFTFGADWIDPDDERTCGACCIGFDCGGSGFPAGGGCGLRRLRLRRAGIHARTCLCCLGLWRAGIHARSSLRRLALRRVGGIDARTCLCRLAGLGLRRT